MPPRAWLIVGAVLLLACLHVHKAAGAHTTDPAPTTASVDDGETPQLDDADGVAVLAAAGVAIRDTPDGKMVCFKRGPHHQAYASYRSYSRGYYDELDELECTNCSPGSFWTRAGCRTCPKGWFCSDGVGKRHCPIGLTTLWPGAASADECIPPPSVAIAPPPAFTTDGVTLNPAVLLVDAGSVFGACDAGSLVLPEVQAAGVAVGSVLLGTVNGYDGTNAAPGEDLTCKLLTRVVTSISRRDGNTVLTTRDATLLDVVFSGTFDATADVPAPEPIDMAAEVAPSPRSGRRSVHTLQTIAPMGKAKYKALINDNVAGIVERTFALTPKFAFSVSVGVAFEVDAPSPVLPLGDSRRLKAFYATARVEAGAGFLMEASLSAGFELKTTPKDVLLFVPKVGPNFPCVPGLPQVPICRLSFKPEAKVELEVRAAVALIGSLSAFATAAGELTGGYRFTDGAFVASTGLQLGSDITNNLKKTCDLRLSLNLKGGFAIILGAGPHEADILDMIKLTAPYYELNMPALLQISSDPRLPDGSVCDNCNGACPSARFSFVPKMQDGLKVELAGAANEAAKAAHISAEYTLFLGIHTLDVIPGVCLPLPSIFSLVQPLCCLATTNLPGKCGNTNLIANNDYITVKEGSSVTFNPLDNDVIPPGRTASVAALGTPAKGIATRNSNSVTYTPSVVGLTASEEDAFSVTIADSSGATATSTTHVDILPATSPPTYTWVTPPSDKGCDDACADVGNGWRAVNGGSPGAIWAMCAGLIDLPNGLGQQWLVGATDSFQAACTIECATNPCWDLPSGAVRDEGYVFAGIGNSYEDANGALQVQYFPIKCACTRCQTEGCDPLFWKPSASAGGCPQPTIPPQGSETFPSTVYSQICRSNEDGSRGREGWVQHGTTPSCRTYVSPSTDFSVWCPQ